MNDVMKPCARCRHEHAIGILRYDQQGTPLYGARVCSALVLRDGKLFDHQRESCGCRDFVEAVLNEKGEASLPAALTMPKQELQALWNETEFLSPQASAETRIAVRRVMEMREKDREKAFIGLMLANLSDIRGAMSKDESKFANLVSHTDEIVESMKGVVQLNERLGNLWQAQRATEDRLANLERGMIAIAEHLGVEVKKPDRPQGEEIDDAEALRLLRPAVRPNHLDEPVVTEGTEVDA
jgi:hypothetical protein